MKDYQEIITKLKNLRNERNIQGMARFGINPNGTLGITMVNLRKIANEIKKTSNDRHELAQKLYKSGIHEAKNLASLINDPNKVTKEEMEDWVADFDSWDVCDQACCSLWDKTPFAYEMARLWSKREKEFTKRAGFALMAGLAWHDKKAHDQDFYPFFEDIKRESTDERNFVRKAANWALRNIGKRNQNLCKKALKVAEEIKKTDNKTAHWIANDAIRELSKKTF